MGTTARRGDVGLVDLGMVAKVYSPETDDWLPVFSWRRSSVTFRAGPYQESLHLRGVVAGLVKSLGARIVDDEGNAVAVE